MIRIDKRADDTTFGYFAGCFYGFSEALFVFGFDFESIDDDIEVIFLGMGKGIECIKFGNFLVESHANKALTPEVL